MASSLPGSLGSLPTSATVPPGSCVFGEEFSGAPLISRETITHNTRLLTFGLPEGKPLGLSTCACILLKAGEADGEAVVRPYTPISTNAMVSKFELLVKIYPDGKATSFLDALPVGEAVECKHIDGNVKVQYPFNKDHIVMLVGGTGITPMIQALHAILGTPTDHSKVTLFFGNQSQDDMLAKEMLQAWQDAFPDQLNLVHILSAEPEDSNWEGERGYITKELLEKNGVKSDEGTMVFVCGPPPLYEALAGPRAEKETITGVLGEMGFSAEQVVKF